MFTTEDMMPGPTPEAKALQHAQWVVLERYYDAHGDARKRFPAMAHEDIGKVPEVVAAREAYDATVTNLAALLGADAHCNFVDSELWSFFSDFYKDTNGFRPRYHLNRTEVKAWIERESKYRAENPEDADA